MQNIVHLEGQTLIALGKGLSLDHRTNKVFLKIESKFTAIAAGLLFKRRRLGKIVFTGGRTLGNRSDFIIAYVPMAVCTTGVVHEVINSHNAKKPTLLVTNTDNIKNIPLWYFGFIKFIKSVSRDSGRDNSIRVRLN